MMRGDHANKKHKIKTQEDLLAGEFFTDDRGFFLNLTIQLNEKKQTTSGADTVKCWIIYRELN